VADPRSVRTLTRVWIGEGDRSVDPSSGRYLARMIPEADLVALADEGHFIGGPAVDAILAWVSLERDEGRATGSVGPTWDESPA
jgi:hypothetical protein